MINRKKYVKHYHELGDAMFKHCLTPTVADFAKAFGDNDSEAKSKFKNISQFQRIEMFKRIKDKMKSIGRDTTIVDKFIEESKYILNDHNS